MLLYQEKLTSVVQDATDGLRSGNRTGARTSLFLCVALTCLACGLWIARWDRSVFADVDVYDYAQMGREIYSGNGASTLQILPRHIPFLHDRGLLQSENWPNLYRYPLPTFFIAAAMFLTGDAVSAAMLQSGLWFLAGVPLVFLLASRLMSAGMAVACTFVYITEPAVLRTAYNGGTMAFAILVVLLVVWITFCRTQSNLDWLLIGALVGLAYLDRTQLAFLAPLTIGYSWLTRSRQRWVPPACILAGLFVVLLPWMVRNTIVAGDPLFSFSTTRNLVQGAFPHGDIEMQLDAPVLMGDVLQQYGKEIVQKTISNIFPSIFELRSWARLFQGIPSVILFFFAVTLVRKEAPSERGSAILKWTVVLLLIANFLVANVLRPDPFFFLIFHPLIIILGGREIFRTVSDWLPSALMPRATLIAGAILILISVPRAVAGPEFVGDFITDLDRKTFDRVQELVPSGSLIATDDSWDPPLVANLRAVRFPLDPNNIFEIDRRYISIDYVIPSAFITSGNEVPEPGRYEDYLDYRTFIQSPAFLDRYEFIELLPNGASLFAKRESSHAD